MPSPTSPFDFTPENIEAVLSRTEDGENLTNIMRDYNSSHARWHERCKVDAELAARYAQARAYHADAYAEAAIDIVEAEPRMTKVLSAKTEDVSERVDTGYLAWQKARFDSRLKVLSFWAKDRYGDQRRDSLDIGSAPGRPVRVEDQKDPATMALAIAAALRSKKRDGEPEFDDTDIDDLI